jgi:hypothetical protein
VRYRDRFGFRRLHYCLMTNHFHLLEACSTTSWHGRRQSGKKCGIVSC